MGILYYVWIVYIRKKTKKVKCINWKYLQLINYIQVFTQKVNKKCSTLWSDKKVGYENRAIFTH